MSKDLAASVRARLLNIAKAEGMDFNQILVRIYFIESGRIAISLAVATGETQRLRTLGPKTVLGEMGLYRSARRSANVVVIRTIADRLEFSSALVAALQR